MNPAERETKEITTPGDHKVFIKTYLTGREVNGVLRDIFKDRETGGDTPKIPMSLGVDRNLKLVEAAVVSLDGVPENAFERIQDLPASEYAFILKQTQSLAEGNF